MVIAKTHPTPSYGAERKRRQRVLPAASELSARLVTKRPEDTSVGCRELAAVSKLRADAMDTANGRAGLELSAATWTMRAEHLDRLEAARARAAQAHQDGPSDPEAARC